MGLTKKQEELYRQTMEEAKSQLDTIDEEMEKEIQKARERLEKLKESKESFRQLYEGAARLLGVEIETEEESPSVEPEEDDEKEESNQKKEDSSDESGS
jgi:uncharacterized membrane-anchored protein YhcB (DUF1043 family)